MAFIVKVDATGQFFFTPSTDRQYRPEALLKGQHDPLFLYLEDRHALPLPLESRVKSSVVRETFPLRLIRAVFCLNCCDDHSAWDLDRDNDLLIRHIRGQLTGLLELQQYQLTDFVQADASWQEGRSLVKLWLTDPHKYEA